MSIGGRNPTRPLDRGTADKECQTHGIIKQKFNTCQTSICIIDGVLETLDLVSILYSKRHEIRGRQTIPMIVKDQTNAIGFVATYFQEDYF